MGESASRGYHGSVGLPDDSHVLAPASGIQNSGLAFPLETGRLFLRLHNCPGRYFGSSISFRHHNFVSSGLTSGEGNIPLTSRLSTGMSLCMVFGAKDRMPLLCHAQRSAPRSIDIIEHQSHGIRSASIPPGWPRLHDIQDPARSFAEGILSRLQRNHAVL